MLHASNKLESFREIKVRCPLVRPMSKLSTGFSHLSRGELEPIIDWVLEQTGQSIAWKTMPKVDEYTLDTLPDSPGLICKINGETNVYTTVFEHSSIRFEPENPFNDLVVPITHADVGDRLELVVEFELSGGLSETQTRVFDTSNFPAEDISFFHLTPSAEAIAADLTLNVDPEPVDMPQVNPFGDGVETRLQKPRLGLPHGQGHSESPPIFVISVDTLRHDAEGAFEPLLDALGPDAVVPEEPRTQGTWTAPSHGSMFTGTYPGTHTYFGGEGILNPAPTTLPPDLETMPEVLAEAGYENSGVVSHTRLLPEYGFGRGFTRYQVDRMTSDDWLAREHDAADVVSKASEWLTRDLAAGTSDVFYFMHLFDPHLPYIPPAEDIPSSIESLEGVEQYREEITQYKLDQAGYTAKATSDIHPGERFAEPVRELYEASVEYTARQLRQFVATLKAEGIFDDSLIILTGDHGEEFGERGFTTHHSLYDANLRQLMVVKPPADADWSVPDAVDTVDILPTVATAAGTTPPDQCSGVPMQESSSRDAARINERITKHCYNIAVERDGIKAIYTFETEWPERPTERELRDGPKLTEFYDLEAVRAGNWSEVDPPRDTRKKLRSAADQFIETEAGRIGTTREVVVNTTDETKEQLQELGYL